VDYDNDGNLDIFVANWGQNHFLYRNNGPSGFTRITAHPLATNTSPALGCKWGDINNDGFLDLIVLNAVNANHFLYMNQENGTFALLIEAQPLTQAGPATSAAWGDYDNDGDLDLYVVGHQGTGLYRNDAGILNRIWEGDIANNSAASVSCSWGDYDKDGLLDLFVANGESFTQDEANWLFHNNGDGSFTRITEGVMVTDRAHSYASGWQDYDNDGDLDLFVANGGRLASQNDFLYRNEGNDNGWLRVKLVGTLSNRSAIGARVKIKTVIGGTEQWQLRHISSDDGISGANLDAFFGLGDATMVELLRIEWPVGLVQEKHNIPINQILTIAEPSLLRPLPTIGNGAFRMEFIGRVGSVYAIEGSSNLVDWIPRFQFTNSTRTNVFYETTSGAAEQFYRAQLLR
jgi:hypothetical protein